MRPITPAELARRLAAGSILLRALAACSVLLTALAACASFRSGSGPDGSAAQQCGPATYPAALPAADAVVDSAALMQGLAGDPAWQRPGTFAVLSITYDPSGDAAFPILVDGSIGTPGKQAPGSGLEGQVRGVLRRPVPSDSIWGVRFRVDGDPLRLSVGRQLYCRPRARGTVSRPLGGGRARQTLMIGDRPTSFSMEPQMTTRPIPIRVLVDASGTVTQVVVTDSDVLTTQQLRNAIEQTAPGLAFAPARRDGVPEPAWTLLYAVVTAG